MTLLVSSFSAEIICYIFFTCLCVCAGQSVWEVFTLCFMCCGFDANSCRGSRRVFAGSALVCDMHVWISMARSSTSQPALVYFLVAGAAVRSLPVSSPTVFVSVGSSLFLFTGRRKQDEHPGQERSHKVWNCGRKIRWPWKWKRGQQIHRHQDIFGLLRFM